MIIIGAKGFAKEILEDLVLANISEQIVFYDDKNFHKDNLLFDTYAILTSEKDTIDYFRFKDSRFTIGIGNPVLRKQMHDKFVRLGGIFTSTISTNSTVGSHNVIIGEGNNVLSGAIISNSVSTGLGCIIYYNSVVTHDVMLGQFVEVSPGAIILGRCKIGNYSQIGANSTILPDINVGSNVIVGAGAVVSKDVPDNCMVAGVPAIVKKQLQPLKI